MRHRKRRDKKAWETLRPLFLELVDRPLVAVHSDVQKPVKESVKR